jgi:hypothetical protein
MEHSQRGCGNSPQDQTEGLSPNATVYVQVTTARLWHCMRFLSPQLVRVLRGACAYRSGFSERMLTDFMTVSSSDYTDYALMDSPPSATVIGEGTNG